MNVTIENVIKHGSETLTNEIGIDQTRVDWFAQQYSQLAGGLVIVSSGAVRIGKAEAPEIDDDQVLAGLGSAGVVIAWKEAFKKQGRYAGQILATDREMRDPVEGNTLVAAIHKDVKNRVIPILNTNDKLNVSELAKRPFKGENDRPAAHISIMVKARRLTLITKDNGLFDDKGEVISYVPFDRREHKRIKAMISKRGSKGQGIWTKVTAAIWAAENGVEGRIAGRDEEIAAVLANETGTYFEPKPVEWRY